MAKRVWRCTEPTCPVSTWTETSEQVRPRAVLSERARKEACRRVGQDAHSVARVAQDFGVGWGVMRAVREYGQARVDNPDRLVQVTALGVDETAFLAANGAHHTIFVTGVVDLARPRLLDVVPGRSGLPCRGGSTSRTTPGERRSASRRSTPSAATPPRCRPACPTRCGCSTPSTSPGSA